MIKYSAFRFSVVAFLSTFVLGLSLPTRATSPSSKSVSAETQQAVRKALSSSSQRPIVVAGGTWTGSGGDGVACFGNTTDASQALDKAGAIKSAYRERIERVFALDTWEFQNEFHFQQPMQNEDPVQYILRAIDKHLAKDMPYFAEKLKKTINILNTSDWKSHWNPQGALPLILDQGSLHREIPENCRLVQLAIRYARSTPGKIPQVFIDVDEDLIARMKNGPSWADGILFTATLFLHEAIWMSGVELNMPDSEGSRRLTAAILSEDIAAAISERPEHLHKNLWTGYLYSLGFRDYFSLFLAEEKIPVDPHTATSKASRRLARARLSRLYKSAFQKLGISEYGALDDQTEKALIGELARQLTPEESFLFVSESLHNGQKIPYNLDVFYLDGLDDLPLLHLSCGIIKIYLQFQKEEGDEMTNESFMKAMEKAMLYCSEYNN